MDYMTQPLVDFLTTSLRRKSGRELKMMEEAAIARQASTLLNTTSGWSDLESLIDKIEVEQEQRTNRTMLRIALIGLVVTGAAALADLVPKLVDWISKLVKLAGL